jgi:hypothetical protein
MGGQNAFSFLLISVSLCLQLLLIAKWMPITYGVGAQQLLDVG